MAKESKEIILYHRAYRRLPGSFGKFLWQFILIAVPLSLLSIFFYPLITSHVSIITRDILAPYFSSGAIKMTDIEYIPGIGLIYFLDLPGVFPSHINALVNTVIAALLVAVSPFIKRAKPLMIFLIYMFFLYLLASLCFLYFPEKFPYRLSDYAHLYMMQEISIWFFIPLIMGLAVLPLPTTIASKVLVMCVTYLYAILFGLVRYVVFLFILSKVSMIYMPIFFFGLGPLVDFVYVVGIYSIYLNRLSIDLRGQFTTWKWQ